MFEQVALNAKAAPAQGFVLRTRPWSVVQPKLEVGQVNDEYEREADRAADQVMRMKEPPERSAISNQLSAVSGQPAGVAVPPEVEARIQNLRGGGHPLSELDRAYFEPRFGHDFGKVRIHDDSGAADLARTQSARAFTVGHDVVFGAGWLSPSTPGGRGLMAHELAHTVQQTPARLSRAPSVAEQSPATGRSVRPGERHAMPGRARARREGPPAAVSHRTGTESAGSSEGGAAPSAVARTSAATDQQPEETPRSLAGPGIEIAAINAASACAAAGEVVPVQAPVVSGTSDEVFTAVTTASASQIAASFPTLGATLEAKLGEERQRAADETPPLQARNSGAPSVPEARAETPAAVACELSAGTSNREPPPELAEVEQLTPAPDNSADTAAELRAMGREEGAQTEGDVDRILASISTTDPGLNTSAGPRPTMDLSGEADPDRAGRLLASAQEQIDSTSADAADAIRSNPGQDQIQPVPVDEQYRMPIPVAATAAMPTPEQTDMAWYAVAPLPAGVRAAADRRMAPLLAASLAGSRQEVAAAAATRNTQVDAAVATAQQQAAELGVAAGAEQDRVVAESRQNVADTQSDGLRRVAAAVSDFNDKADTERRGVAAEVDTRLRDDEAQATETLDSAEQEAEEERRRGEEDAERKKAELEQAEGSGGLWDWAKSKFEAFVEDIASAIDDIFKEIRAGIKTLIAKAKQTALDFIERGRQWLVEKLDQFGGWLKGVASDCLASFPEAQAWVNEQIDGAVATAKDFVNTTADGLKRGVEALADFAAAVIDKALSVYQTLLTTGIRVAGALMVGDFAGAAKWALLGTCDALGIDTKPILDFINRAGELLKRIFDDPVAFFNNVASGVGLGVRQFVDNIGEHLKTGLFGWLTGTLSDAGITLPDTFDAPGIFSLVMQILGLTYQNIRAKVVRAIGPRGEEAVTKVEKAVTFVAELVRRGPIVLWEKVKDLLSGLGETVLSGIREWVTINVIKRGVTWVLSLLSPASALVQAVVMLYNVVMFLIERYRQIIAFAQAVYDSIAELAAGQVAKAANSVEQALARSVPVVISFLASLLGLGGISDTIRRVVARVRAPVDRALESVIGWLVAQGKALLAGAQAAVGRLVAWWQRREPVVTADGAEHALYFEGTAEAATLMIKSAGQGFDKYVESLGEVDEAKKNEMLANYRTISRTSSDRSKSKEEKEAIISPRFNRILELLPTCGPDGPGQTEHAAIPIMWPKPAYTEYRKLYLPPLNSDLAKLALSNSDLKRRKKGGDHRIQVYQPGGSRGLPDATGNAGDTVIGIGDSVRDKNCRVSGGVPIKMDNVYASRGGGKLINALKPYQKVLSQQGLQADHVLERQLGGPDELGNLWPLRADVNQSAGPTIAGMSFTFRGQTIPMSRLKEKVLQGREQKPVWFRVVATGPADPEPD